MAEASSPELVLVGKVGCGKSASGNTILGREAFRTSCGFSAVTKTCEMAEGSVCGRRISLVDTPGLDCVEVFPSYLAASLPETTDNIVNVFLLVIELGRFTGEQRAAVQKMEDIFGERVRESTMILFTYGDCLNNSISDFLAKAGEPLGQIMKRYGGRYHVFNNLSDDPCQVTELFEKIDRNFQCCLTEQGQEDLRIVLVGKTGVGKSSSGNTILGREAFRTSCGFSAVTKRCEIVEDSVCGRRVSLVDTPGLDHAEVSPAELCASLREMTDNIVFLLVMQLGRFTEEQRAAVEKMEDVFGERVREHTVILFTYGDCLNTSIEDFICRAGDPLGKVVQRYGGRYHVFNNESEHRDQVKELLEKMETVTQNRNYTFSSLLPRQLTYKVRNKGDKVRDDRTDVRLDGDDVRDERDDMQWATDDFIRDTTERRRKGQQRRHKGRHIVRDDI